MKNTIRPAYVRIGNVIITCRAGAAASKPVVRLPRISVKRIGVKA